MQNRFPLWKNLLIVLVLLVGVFYALPNLFGEDPAVQVSPLRGAEGGQNLLLHAKNVLQKGGVTPLRIELLEGKPLIRFESRKTS